MPKNNADRRTRERQEVRLRIVDAARELFVAGGEEAVTLRKVAEKIEYSATTIYLYFPHKEALIQELCAGEFAAFARVFKHAERISEPVERLKKISLAYVDFGLQFPCHYRSMFSGSTMPEKMPAKSLELPLSQTTASVGTQPVERTPSAQLYDFLHSSVFKAAAAGCFKPEHRDLAMITQLVWSGLHGIVMLHFVRARHSEVAWRSVHDATEAMLDALLHGLARRDRI